MKRMTEMAQILVKGSVNPETLKQFLLAVLKVVKEAKDETANTAKKNENTMRELRAFEKKIEGYHAKMLADVEKATVKNKAHFEDCLKEAKDLLALVKKAQDSVKDGEDGEDGSPDTPEEVRDKLEGLTKGKKLSINAIDELPELLEEIMKEAKNKGEGSGAPARILAPAKVRFIDDFTPVGTIDGANTIFKVSKTPAAGSLKVYRNGMRQRVTEDYTFDNYRTITFLNAPQVGEILLVDFRY